MFTIGTIVVDASGNPLAGVEVTIINNVTGLVTSRYTNEGGCNQPVAGEAGTLCTILTNGYQFIGSSAAAPEGPMYYRLTGQPSQLITLTAAPFKKPFRAAPRFWKANMCGIRIPGLPAIPGSTADPSLFLSWFYDYYDAHWRAVARQAMKAAGYTHWLLSWPDSQANGQTPAQFRATILELTNDGFFPCPMMSAKPTSSDTIRSVEGTLANIMLVLPALKGLIPLCSVGWELSLWLSPDDVQFLIDNIAAVIVPSGCRLYVHFQEGYSWWGNGGSFASFWNQQVGKLTGILRQKLLRQNRDQYRYDSGGISDVLTRFAGNFGVVSDSGFGHPFDDVELEITATFQFDGSMSEAEGDSWGQWAIDTPPLHGPAGTVSVMGSGNGCAH